MVYGDYTCPKCGKICASENGYSNHLNKCSRLMRVGGIWNKQRDERKRKQQW